MGITYFALGALSMMVLMFVGIVVWGLFRVGKIERHIVDIKENHKIDYDNFQRQIENIYRYIDERGIDVNEKFNKMDQLVIKQFDELWRQINDRFDDSVRYTDKRIDKSLNQKEVL